jgi:hypothetical protein
MEIPPLQKTLYFFIHCKKSLIATTAELAKKFHREAWEIDARTPIIKFERQLWPSPPAGTKPYFCGLNTLIFYDANHAQRWVQRLDDFDMFDSDMRKIKVDYDEKWGWILSFEVTHEKAKKIWKENFNCEL